MSGDINYKSNFVSYVLADVIIFVQKVPFIFWHYVNVDEVSRITLKKLLQSAMELMQIATTQFITKCDTLKTGITKCDEFISNCDGYYKVRSLLQIATVQMSPEWKLGWASSINNQQRKLTFFSYSTSKPVTVILSSTSIMYEKIIINFSLRYCVLNSHKCNTSI